MSTEPNLPRLLSLLTKQTSKGQLDWAIADPPTLAIRGTDNVYPLFFETKYKGQTIGLGQCRYRGYDAENDRLIWDERLVMMFIDHYGRVIWEATQPYSALSNLFITVREKAADVDGILSHLLADDPDGEA
jgi:hypothetical protein